MPRFHRYDADDGLWANIVGPDPSERVFWCPDGFLIATDASGMIALAGTAIGAALWNVSPRVSAAALSGSIVYWLSYQYASLQQELKEIRVREAVGSEAAKLKEFMYEAATSQIIFELLAFVLVPILAIALLRATKPRLAPIKKNRSTTASGTAVRKS